MDWIRQRREALGMKSQGDLATRLQLEGIDVTRASVSHWENGRHRATFEDPQFIQALSRVLRMPENEILRLAGFDVNRAYSERAEYAAYMIDQLDEERQSTALKILEVLVSEQENKKRPTG